MIPRRFVSAGLAGLLVTVGGSSWFHRTSHATEPAALPGPAKKGAVDRKDVRGMGPVTSATCGACHGEIAAEWHGSLHQAAWSDAVFQKGYAVEPKAFCRGCHAPESDPASEPSALAQTEGVSCVTCHVRDHRVVGSGHGGDSAHPFQQEARLASSAACAGCHQFNFPPDSHQVVPSPMQNTFGEWQRSSFATTSCQNCHMPVVQGSSGATHRSHRFQVMGNAALLRSALEVAARREGARGVLTLQAAQVGHAFPTGDMFRRLQIRARAFDPVTGQVVGSMPPVELARTFRDVPVQAAGATNLTLQRVEGADTRLGPPGSLRASRTLTLVVPQADARHALAWEVVYQRMMNPLTLSHRPPQVAEEILLVSGILSPLPR